MAICLFKKNTEKYITFPVPIEKEVKRIDKKKSKTVSYRLKFVDSSRFMGSSLWDHLKNLAEGIRRTKCKPDMIIKNVKHLESNTNILSAVLNTQILKMIS